MGWSDIYIYIHVIFRYVEAEHVVSLRAATTRDVSGPEGHRAAQGRQALELK